MGGGEDIADDLQRVAALGASEDTENDLVEQWGRAYQKAPLDGAAGGHCLGDFPSPSSQSSDRPSKV